MMSKLLEKCLNTKDFSYAYVIRLMIQELMFLAVIKSGSISKNKNGNRHLPVNNV
jgi:hypothetical protein